jgi:sugar phosphate isomerase/epimerase
MPGIHTRRSFLGAGLAAGSAWVLGFSARGRAKALLPFKLGIITDEIAGDFGQAANFLKSNSLTYCELRELWDKNIMNLSQGELTRARQIIRGHGLRVSNIASPLFKYDLPEMPAPVTQRDIFRAQFTDQDTDRLLGKAIDLAHFFDTKLIRIFSYWRVADPGIAYPYVRDRLAKAADIARANGIVLCLENEPACNVGTGQELGRMLKEINSQYLRGVWDPGNAVTLGEVPFPDGYRAVRGWFSHVHVKDVKKHAQSGEYIWVPIGSGVVDYRGLLKALREDKYTGVISLETHYRRPDGNKLESTRESLGGLLAILRELG